MTEPMQPSQRSCHLQIMMEAAPDYEQQGNESPPCCCRRALTTSMVLARICQGLGHGTDLEQVPRQLVNAFCKLKACFIRYQKPRLALKGHRPVSGEWGFCRTLYKPKSRNFAAGSKL
jgi:hypothetical protein